MDRYERDQFHRHLIRRIQRNRKEAEEKKAERKRAYYESRKNWLRRWSVYALDSMMGNLHDAAQSFSATVAENLLRICYGVLMLILFFSVASYLVHNLKSVWIEEPQQVEKQ